MRQSKVFEWIMLTLLTVNSASLSIYYLPKGLIDQSIGRVCFSILFGPTQIMFMSIFYFQMRNVNAQFHRLFKQIDDKSYPKKSIEAILLNLYCTTLAQNVIKIILYFFTGYKLLYQAVLMITLLYEQWFFTMFTLFMYYLVDFKYDIKRKKSGNQK